ncbi:hypothetical protein UFOVP844_22 [uncultured Caudovirales phage]|uniref:Uncharacterized protein n=1 Tax=uncultured Caudovirales phage TaxID=2100421 RepID=A0A6J5PA79_9CAUD|nr:hypothetical protein UFOVP844_22 [uncultured Caudovirales phage]
MSYLQSDISLLSVDKLVEALMQSQGFLSAAQSYIAKKWQYHFSLPTLRKSIERYNLTEYVNEMRSKIVEDCYRKTYQKAVVEGDNTCLQYYLENYGHHVDFLGSKDTETTMKGNVKEILATIKSFQSETNRQHSELDSAD